MKTHRIILPVPQHEAALRGVDRLLLPMDLQPKVEEDAGVTRFYMPGWAYSGKRAFAEDGCIYKPGDRLALLERWDSYEDGRWFIYTQNHPDAERFVWKPASRMPLRACRCFNRVLAVEPVLQPKLSDQNASGVVGAWVWSVQVERGGKMPEHEMQHADAPTWCIHCGTFSVHSETTECTDDRAGKWDARKNPRAIIEVIFGKRVMEATW